MLDAVAATSSATADGPGRHRARPRHRRTGLARLPVPHVPGTGPPRAPSAASDGARRAARRPPQRSRRVVAPARRSEPRRRPSRSARASSASSASYRATCPRARSPADSTSRPAPSRPTCATSTRSWMRIGAPRRWIGRASWGCSDHRRDRVARTTAHAGARVVAHPIRWMRTHPAAHDAAPVDEHLRPTHYVIRVRGVLSDRLLTAFPGLRSRAERGDTVLRARCPTSRRCTGSSHRSRPWGSSCSRSVARDGDGRAGDHARGRRSRRRNRSDRTTPAHPGGPEA